METTEAKLTPMSRGLLSRLKIVGVVLAVVHALLFFVALSTKTRLTPFANGIILMLYGALFIYFIVTGLAALKGIRSSSDNMSVFVKILLLISGLASILSILLFMLMEDISVVMATISMILALAAWAMILFVMFFYTGEHAVGNNSDLSREDLSPNPIVIADKKGLVGILNSLKLGGGGS